MLNLKQAAARRAATPEFRETIAKRAITALAVSCCVNAMLCVAVVVLLSRKPAEHYFYTDGRDTPRLIYPTDQPLLSPAQTMRWAVDSVCALYTMDFVHYREQLNKSAEAFDAQGWNTWAKAFRQQGNIDRLTTERLVLSAVPGAAPSIKWEGVDQGVYTWRIKFPLLLHYENQQGDNKDTLDVTVIVRRTTNPLHPDGLVITALNAPIRQGGAP